MGGDDASSSSSSSSPRPRYGASPRRAPLDTASLSTYSLASSFDSLMGGDSLLQGLGAGPFLDGPTTSLERCPEELDEQLASAAALASELDDADDADLLFSVLG